MLNNNKRPNIMGPHSENIDSLRLRPPFDMEAEMRRMEEENQKELDKTEAITRKAQEESIKVLEALQRGENPYEGMSKADQEFYLSIDMQNYENYLATDNERFQKILDSYNQKSEDLGLVSIGVINDIKNSGVPIEEANIRIEDYISKTKEFRELHSRTYEGVRGQIKTAFDQVAVTPTGIAPKVEGSFLDSGFYRSLEGIPRTLFDNLSAWTVRLFDSDNTLTLTEEEESRYDYLKKYLAEIEAPHINKKLEELEKARQNVAELKDERLRSPEYQESMRDYNEKSDRLLREHRTNELELHLSNRPEDSEILAYNTAEDFLKRSEDYYTQALKAPHRSGWNNFFAGVGHEWYDTASFQVTSILPQLLVKELAEKPDEERTDAENMLLLAFQTYAESKEAIDPDNIFFAGLSAQESIGFVLEMLATRGVLSSFVAAGRKATTIAGRKFKTNILRATIAEVVRSQISPSSYGFGMEYYMENDIDILTGPDGDVKVLMSEAQRQAYNNVLATEIEELESAKYQLEFQLAGVTEGLFREDRYADFFGTQGKNVLSINDELARINKSLELLYEHRDRILDEEGAIKRNRGLFKSAIAGIWTTLMERTEEKSGDFLFDPLLRRIPGVIRRGLSRGTKSVLPGSTVGKLQKIDRNIASRARRASRSLDNVSNKYLITRALRENFFSVDYISNPVTEMFEEGFGQFLPEFFEDVGSGIDELFSSTFYRNIFWSTLFTGSAMGTFNTALTSPASFFGMNSLERKNHRDFFKAKRALNDWYNHLDKTVTNPDEARNIALGAAGILYDQTDVRRALAALENPKGKTPEQIDADSRTAKRIREINAANSIAVAIETGSLPDLIENYERIINDPTVPQESKRALQKYLDRAKRFEKLQKDMEGKFKSKEIIKGMMLLEIEQDKLEEADAEIKRTRQESIKKLEELFKDLDLEGWSVSRFISELRDGIFVGHTQQTYAGNEISKALIRLEDADLFRFVTLTAGAPVLQNTIDSINSRILDLQDQQRSYENMSETIKERHEQETAVELSENANRGIFKNIINKLFGLGKATSNTVSKVHSKVVEDHLHPDKVAAEKQKGNRERRNNTPVFNKEEISVIKDLLGEDSNRGKTPVTERAIPEVEPVEPDKTETKVSEEAEEVLLSPGEREKSDVEKLTDLIKSFRKSRPNAGFRSFIAEIFNAGGKEGLKRHFDTLLELWEAETGTMISSAELVDIHSTYSFDFSYNKEIANLFPKNDGATNAGADGVTVVPEEADSETVEPPKKQDKETRKQRRRRKKRERERIRREALEGKKDPRKTQARKLRTIAFTRGLESAQHRANQEMTGAEPVLTSHTATNYDGTGLKAGHYVGRNYAETPDGRQTTSETINTTAIPFLDFRNFIPGHPNKGDMELVFNIGYLLNMDNKITVWENLDSLNDSPNADKPTKKVITTREYLENTFPDMAFEDIIDLLEEYQETRNPEGNPLFENEEFLKTIPVGLINKGYTNTDAEILDGGLPNYYWFNNANVTLWAYQDANTRERIPAYVENGQNVYVDLEERRTRIELNREQNLAARRAILEGKNGRHTFRVKDNIEAHANRVIEIVGEDNNGRPIYRFHSILSDFKNLEEFHDNAVVAVWHNGKFLTDIPTAKRGNKSESAKIKGVDLNESEITNKREWLENAQRRVGYDNKTLLNGRTVMIVKTGVRPDGSFKYTVYDLITNHPHMQFRHADTEKKWDSLYYEILSTMHNSRYSDEQRETFLANFRELFGFELTMEIKDLLKRLSPNSQNASKKVLAEFNTSAINDPIIGSNKVPDISMYNSVHDFINAVLNKDESEIHTKDKFQMALENFHSRRIFTRMEDASGEVVYSSLAQNIIMMETLESESTPDRSSTNTNPLLTQQHIESLKKIEKSIIGELNEATNPAERDILKSRLATVRAAIARAEGRKVSEDGPESDNTIETNDLGERLEKYSEQDLEFIIPEILARAISGINFTNKEVSLREIYKAAEKALDDLINDLDEAAKKASEKDGSEVYSPEADFLRENYDRILGRGLKNFEGSIKEYMKYHFEVLNEDEILTLDSENLPKNWDTGSSEIDQRKSLSGILKLMLSGIPDSRAEAGFAGLKPALSGVDALNAIQQILKDMDSNNFEDLLKGLEKRSLDNPVDLEFYNTLKERLTRLNELNPGVIRHMLHKLYQPSAEYRMVLWNLGLGGTFNVQVIDANSRDPSLLKQRTWSENLKTSPLIEFTKGSLFKINSEAYKQYSELWLNMKKKFEETYDIQSIDRKDFERLLEFTGIALNRQTIDNMYQKEGLHYNEMVTSLFSGNNSIFNVIFINFATVAGDITETNFSMSRIGIPKALVSSTRLFNPLTYNNSRLIDLAHLDNVVEFIPDSTLYVAGKTLYTYQQPNQITEGLTEIKSDLKAYVDHVESGGVKGQFTGKLARMAAVAETSTDPLLKAILENPREVLDLIGSFQISLEALKERGKSSREDMGVDKLSERDALTLRLSLFGHNLGSIRMEDSYVKTSGRVKYRKGYAEFPTASDSGHLEVLKTILLDLQDENVNVETDKIHSDIIDILIEHMLEGDLRRIFEYVNLQADTGVEYYDDGVMFIHGIPALNTLAVDDVPQKGSPKTKIGLVQRFVKNLELERQAALESGVELDRNSFVRVFINQFKSEISQGINEHVTSLVNDLISKDGSSGALIENGLAVQNKEYGVDNETGQIVEIGSEEKIVLTSGAKREGVFKKSPRLLAYDLVINSLIQKYSITNTFAGGLSYYFKSDIARQLEGGLPKLNFHDVAKYFYTNDQIREIYEILGNSNMNKIPDHIAERLLSKFPELELTEELIDPYADPMELYERKLPIISMKVAEMYKEVSDNLQKRLKSLVTPGHVLNNADMLPDYAQILVADKNSVAEGIEMLIRMRHPKLLENMEFIDKLLDFKSLDDLYDRDRYQESEYRRLRAEISEIIPDIADYLNTNATDAQEYTTWKEHMLIVKNSTEISDEDYERIYAKLEAQSKDVAETGAVKPENRLSKEDLDVIIFQPMKPVTTGTIPSDMNGHAMDRPIYIKSSSFPLLPEMTAPFSEKMDKRRQAMEHIEDVMGTTARLAYGSAVKVGGAAQGLSISALDAGADVDMELVSKSIISIPRRLFKVQQEVPYSGDSGRSVRMTQFEKIILGDELTEIPGEIFESANFDKSLLEDLGITPGKKLTGQELRTILTELYKREQELKKNRLLNELGAGSIEDIHRGNPRTMRRIHRILEKSLDRKQDKKAIELKYIMSDGSILNEREYKNSKLKAEKAVFSFMLHMSPNSNKLESVLLSLVSKNNINLTLPGRNFVIGSQEGFDYRGYSPELYEDLLNKGFVAHPNFDPSVGLKANQVFLTSTFRFKDVKTGEYVKVDITKYVDEKGRLDLERIPQDLVEFFTARIPTSSHQSGSLVEVAGFLPDSMGDLMIVSKNATIQLGEDYDVDQRYTYQYNYKYDESTDSFSKVTYEDLVDKPTRKFSEIRNEYRRIRDQFWRQYYERKGVTDPSDPLSSEVSPVTLINEYLIKNTDITEELIRLEILLEDFDTMDFEGKLITPESLAEFYGLDEFTKENIEARIEELQDELYTAEQVENMDRELRQEYRDIKAQIKDASNAETQALKELWEEYRDAVVRNITEEAVIENNIISIYNTVFKSEDTRVKSLITSVLSTDFSMRSAQAIDAKINKPSKHFNIYDGMFQKSVMEAGSIGKDGIGIHSNAVTFNSTLQQAKNKLKFFWTNEETGDKMPYKIKLGSLTFDGILGKVTDESGNKISDYIMESQNSATDNQNLGIMGMRNENSTTIGAFVILQGNGIEREGVVTKDDGTQEVISYASLFIAQPVLRELHKLTKNVRGSLSYSPSGGIASLRKELIKNIPEEYWRKDPETSKPQVGVLSFQAKERLGEGLTSQELYNMLDKDFRTDPQVAAFQFYVLNTFQTLSSLARRQNKLQRIMNIESNGLGKSFYDVISLKNQLIELAYHSDSVLGIDVSSNVDSSDAFSSGVFEEMIGEFELVNESSQSVLEEQGFIYVSDYRGQKFMVKPTTYQGHKIVNSIALGYNMFKNFFPYDERIVRNQLESLSNMLGVNLSSNEGQEFTYSVLRAMKDFSYSNPKTLFGENVEEYRKKIFFNDPANFQESLASYLNRIKNMKDDRGVPVYSQLFNGEFFKNIETQISGVGYPSLILFNNSKDVDNLKIYNSLKNLINSDKKLPNKLDGTQMTEAELMKQLLMYSLLSSQESGAVGFRDKLPVELFEKYKVTEDTREILDFNSKIPEIAFETPIKRLELLLSAKMDDFGIIKNDKIMSLDSIQNEVADINRIMKEQFNYQGEAFSVDDNGNVRYNNFTGQKDNFDSFVTQFIQHNPHLVTFNISANNEVFTGISRESFNRGHVDRMTLTLNETPQDFVVVTTNLGELQLFRLVDSNVITFGPKTDAVAMYERIPILGGFGFNEYNFGVDVTKSQITDHNHVPGRVSDLIPAGSKDFYISLNDKGQIDRFKDHNPQDIFIEYITQPGFAEDYVTRSARDLDNEYRELFSLLESFVPEGLKVEIVDELAGPAGYKPKTNTIVFKRSSLMSGMSKTIFDKLMAEEVLHSVTTTVLGRYGSFTLVDGYKVGFKPKTGIEIPSEIHSIVSLMNYAVDHYVTKFGAEKFDSIQKMLRSTIKDETAESMNIADQDHMTAYRLLNVHEFLAGILIKDSDFNREMAETPYKKSGENILTRFANFIHRLLHRLLPNNRRDTVSAQSLASLIELLHKDFKTERKSRTDVPPPDTGPVDDATEILGSLPIRQPRSSPVKTISKEGNEITIDKSSSLSDLKDLPVYSEKGINTSRKSGHQHFGNPFSEVGIEGLIKVDSREQAIEAYENWLEGDNSMIPSKLISKFDKQREWILNQIDLGRLENKVLLDSNERFNGKFHRSTADALGQFALRRFERDYMRAEIEGLSPEHIRDNRIVNSVEFTQFYTSELTANIDTSIEEALEYFKKCK